MKKRIIALLTCIAVIISLICIVPESNAGIQSLNLSKQEKSIKVGESFQLTMTGIKASSIKWKSSKPGVATVSKKGIVKGIKPGKATITGKYSKVKFTIVVTVTKTYKNTFSNGDATAQFVSAKMGKHYEKDLFAIKFLFTNSSSKPVYFSEKFRCIAFVNGIEKYEYTTDNSARSIKDGATIDVSLYYEVSKGDKLEFELQDTEKYKTVFKQTYIIP